MQETFLRSFAEAEAALNQFRFNSANIELLERIGMLIADCFRNRGRVFCCGNGGSMADALHFAEECTGRFKEDRQPYPAMALGEATHSSCVSNDYGFEQVFSRQVDAFGHAGDVLMLLSTTGNSENLLRAVQAAKKRGVKTVAFVGRGGGKLGPICDYVLDAPGQSSDRIQEIHMMALHALVEAVESVLEQPQD
ncbi:MAG TPA: SIS domain-containing protein [Fimbriimonadaceae bacterium]|jgi:D-sedoheptulose 7-phosphate isomerase